MQEQKVEIATADGTADAYFYGARDGLPGVVMYTDILGVRAAFQDMAKRLSAEGYAVLLPNVFYRVSKMPIFDFPPKFGEEKTVARIGELRPSVSADLFTRDAAAYAAFLAKKSGGRVGAVGYCMGGAMAVRTAAAAPGSVVAAASFHGSNLAADTPDSPHLLAPKIKARLYFGFAVEDKTMPPEAIAKLNAALDAAHVRHEDDVYEGARHGWCVKDHNVYNPPQANLAWGRLLTFFREALAAR